MASWGDIAQNSTKRRPASAPTVKRDFAHPGESNLSARGGGARLVDVSTRKDGQMSFFRRTEEIRTVVGLMREAEKVRASALRVCAASLLASLLLVCCAQVPAKEMLFAVATSSREMSVACCCYELYMYVMGADCCGRAPP